MIHVPIDTTPEGAIPVRIVTDADRDAGATGLTLTLKWQKAGASAWTTLTASTHYTVAQGAGGIYWITLTAASLFDTVGGAVLEVSGTAADEYYERFHVFTPANLAAVPVTLSAAERNAAADHVLRRSLTSARASSNGDTVGQRSLLGQIAKYVNRTRINGADLEVYEEDDTTVFYTQDVTTNASAEPITEIS